MICGHAPWTIRSLATGRLIRLRWHHSRPITMTSTTSPLCSSTYCSVFGGSIRSPLAVRMLISLLLTWFPATAKKGGWNSESRRFFVAFCIMSSVWFVILNKPAFAGITDRCSRDVSDSFFFLINVKQKTTTHLDKFDCPAGNSLL